MKVFRGIAVAFSMYSKIPMPIFEWKDDDMSRGLMFFPLVGVVIGVISVALYNLAIYMGFPELATMLILGLTPVVITGGFHIDGFMDMTDALRSYQSKEKKLQILKDPHIGAFAVIGLCEVMLTYGTGLAFLLSKARIEDMICYGLIFVISRAISGISAICLNKAKKDGMLYEETKTVNKATFIVLLVQMVIANGMLVYINAVRGIILLVCLCIIVIYYRYRTYKEFGGVTGDTAGYLVTVTETILVLLLGIMTWYGL